MKKIRLKAVTLVFMLLLFAVGRGSSLSICIPNYNLFVFAIFAAILVVYLIKRKNKIKKKEITANWHPLVLFALLLPSMLLIQFSKNLGSNLLLAAGILSVYLLTLNYSKQELMQGYADCLFFLAVISLVCFLFFNILGLPVNWMLYLTKAADSREHFRSILLYSIRLGDDGRNCGPFWEPSIFSIYLVYALQVELFQFDAKRRERMAVLLAAILSTLSTGGFSFLMITAMIWLWRKRKYSFLAFFITLFAVLSVAVGWDLIQAWLLSINYNLFSKIFHFSTNKSSLSRVYSILTNFDIWKSSPLLGVGQVAVDTVYSDISRQIVPAALGLSPSQSATPIIFLASFGLGGLFYTACWIMAVLKRNSFNPIQKILFGIFIFLALVEVPQTNFLLTYYLLFTLLHTDVKRRVQNKRIKMEAHYE